MGSHRAWWRRSAVIAGLAAAGLAIGGVAAVHALASGGSTSPSSPTRLPSPPRTPTGGRPLAPPAGARPLAPQVSPNSLPAANVHCGEVVTASVTANTNLSCSSTGLIISGSNITVNLNGHYVAGGSSGGVGILVSGSHDIVENGFVNGFATSVVVGALDSNQPTNDTVTGLQIVASQGDGIDVYAINTSVTNNAVGSNSGGGIATEQTERGGIFKNNRISSNSGIGLDTTTAPAIRSSTTSSMATIRWHLPYGNFATVTGNTADFNGNDGIYNLSSTTIDGGGNLAKGNDRAGYGNINTSSTSSVPAVGPEECLNIICT